MEREKIFEKCCLKLKKMLGGELPPSTIGCRAPGRINLIGEHTDYNEGFVLPITISREIDLVAALANSKRVSIYSFDFDETSSFDLDKLEPRNGWIDYAIGVAWFLQEESFSLKGFNSTCLSTIPIGAGLSSSAAFEVVTAQAFKQVSNFEIAPEKLALISFKAENVFMGISCGIMDQFISALGKRNSALFLDCRPPYEHELVPLDLKNLSIMIFNTNVKHSVKDFINKRKDECFEGTRLLKRYLPEIKTLRDVNEEDFNRLQKYLPQPIRNRCKHVILENERVLDVVELLKKNKINEIGSLLYDSHESLRDLYEVSCPELDFIVNFIQKEKGVIGGRLTGAGMGGCAFAIVEKNAVERLQESMTREYLKKFKRKLDVYPCTIPNGVEKVDISQFLS
ncbi:MAG: galactokinase [Candidatus Helarchaeales archaeon]